MGKGVMNGYILDRYGNSEWISINSFVGARSVNGWIMNIYWVATGRVNGWMMNSLGMYRNGEWMNDEYICWVINLLREWWMDGLWID